MAKTTSLEDRLASLTALRAEPKSPATLTAVRAALADKPNLVAARAAMLSAEFGLTALVPELEAAFDRFMQNPVKSDRGCEAKKAIAKALEKLGAPSEGIFLRGIRHVQLEPVWGGSADTAGELRGACAFGLVRMGYHDVLTELAGLLADEDKQARVAAVQAIGHAGSEFGVPLLRFKALTGDDDSEVLSECFVALMRLSPRGSLPFVADFLESRKADVPEAAALAIGTSRDPAAFELLKMRWENVVDPDLRRALALSIASQRSEAALELLLAVVSNAGVGEASDALAALALYRHDESIRARATAAVESRNDAGLTKVLREEFGSR